MQKARIETEFGPIFVERDASLPHYKNVAIRHVSSGILLSTAESAQVARYLLDFAREINPYSVTCDSRTPIGGTVVDMDHPCPYPAVASSVSTRQAACPFHMRKNRNEFGFSS